MFEVTWCRGPSGGYLVGGLIDKARSVKTLDFTDSRKTARFFSKCILLARKCCANAEWNHHRRVCECKTVLHRDTVLQLLGYSKNSQLAVLESLMYPLAFVAVASFVWVIAALLIDRFLLESVCVVCANAVNLELSFKMPGFALAKA